MTNFVSLPQIAPFLTYCAKSNNHQISKFMKSLHKKNIKNPIDLA